MPVFTRSRSTSRSSHRMNPYLTSHESGTATEVTGSTAPDTSTSSTATTPASTQAGTSSSGPSGTTTTSSSKATVTTTRESPAREYSSRRPVSRTPEASAPIGRATTAQGTDRTPSVQAMPAPRAVTAASERPPLAQIATARAGEGIVAPAPALLAAQAPSKEAASQRGALAHSRTQYLFALLRSNKK